MAVETRPNNAENRIWLAAEEALGSHMLVNERFISKLTGDDLVSFDPRPTISKWQFVQACADAGITETQIDTAVALLTNKRQRFWKYTQVIDRDNPFSSNLRTNLTPVPTPAQWTDIFQAASLLDPLTV